MAKNMTRKGLALGSAVALVAAGFSLPANAAGLADTSFIALAPSAGTEYAVLAGANETFTLRANEASTLTTGNVKFLVEDANSVFFPAAGSTGVTYADAGQDLVSWTRTNGTVSMTFTAGHGLTAGEIFAVETALDSTTPANEDVAVGYYTVASATATVVTFVDGGEDVTAGAGGAATVLGQSNIVRAVSGNFVVDSGISTSATNEDLILAVMSANTVSTNVTAWKDANANGTIDSTEYASPVRTVQFLKGSDITAVVTADSYIVGANTSTAVGYATTTPALNGNFMSTGDIVLRFNHQGNANNFDVNAAFNTTTRKWSATSSANITIAAGAHSVVARIGTAAISPVLSIAVAAAKAANGSTAITQDVNNNVTVSVDAGTPANDGNAASVIREKTLTASATMSFIDALKAAVPANRPVKVTVTTLTGATGVKINGTAVVAGDVLDVVTNASGAVVANVTATTANAGASLVLTGVAEGVAASSTTATFTWTAASFTLSDLNGTSSLVRSIAKGGSNTFSFAAVDQWSQPLAGNFRLKVAASGNTVSETYPAFAAGTATVTVSDAQIAAGGDITVVVTPQKLQIDGTTWSGTGAPAPVTYTIKTIDQSGGGVTLTSGDASIPVVTAALAAGDSRTTQAAVSDVGNAGTTAIHLTGVVSNAVTAVVRGGAPITVSGPANVLFVHGTKAAYGSLTFHADANGAYTVAARSNTAQKDTVITVASQGGSETIKVTFEPAAATAGAAVAIDAPASVTPGSTLVVTVTLTDKFGNAVRNNNGTTLEANNAVTVAYTGPGLIVGSITNLTDAAGKITFRVLLGANDTGSASVTATFQKNTVATTDDLTVTKSVTIGTAGNTGDYSSWTKKLDDNSAKIYAKNVVGAGKVQFMLNGKEIAWVNATSAADSKLRSANGSSYLVRTVEFADGKNVLEVYVDGVRTTRTAYTK